MTNAERLLTIAEDPARWTLPERAALRDAASVLLRGPELTIRIGALTAELSTLRAELAAEKERADGNYASIERIKAKWEATCAELATHRSRRAVFEMRIAELEKNLAAAKEHGEQYRKNWLALQNATGEQCHLRALEWIAAATARATAAEAHAETLRKALETVVSEVQTIASGKEEEVRNDFTSGESHGWGMAYLHICGIAGPAIASTPPRSLAAVKADALEEAAKALPIAEKSEDSDLWKGIRCGNMAAKQFLEVIAEQLRKED